MHSTGHTVNFWGGRQKRNTILYLWIYGLLGAVTGVLVLYVCALYVN